MDMIPVVALPNVSWAQINDELDGEKHQSLESVVNTLYTNLVQRQTSAPDIRVFIVGCGTGAHAVEFAKRGASVFGMDSDFQNLDATVIKQVKAKVSFRLFHSEDKKIQTLNQLDAVVLLDAAVHEFIRNDIDADRYLLTYHKML